MILNTKNRKYIPFAFVSPEIRDNNAVQMIPGASLCEFGVLMSVRMTLAACMTA